MSAFYNEIDPFAAEWLRELIKHGSIAPGVVDERDVRDIRPSELAEFTQCHFFAGIGVWSYALRLAGWQDDWPVWTGSCPCQPFSAAGYGKGFTDERHVWPYWFHLIKECGPDRVFGEQVSSKDGLAWFDLVQADLESEDYAVGVVDSCAAGVGAPHIRQRLYWVGQSNSERLERPWKKRELAETAGQIETHRVCGTDDLPNPYLPFNNQRSSSGQQPVRVECNQFFQEQPFCNSVNGFWKDADWLGCRDGKFRPVEPGTFPLADGVASRMGQLRGYGNAIVAPQAQAFIEAYMNV